MIRKHILTLVLAVFCYGVFPAAQANDSQKTMSPVLMEYYQEIKSRIDKQFNKFLKDKTFSHGLKVKILCGADAKGNILNPSIKQSSGDIEFDQLAISVLLNLKKLPEPPKEIVDEVVSEGFLFEFNPDKINTDE